MKKAFPFLCLALLALAAPFAAFGEQEVWWGSNYMPGNLVVAADVSIDTVASAFPGVAVYPEAEYIIFKPYIGDMSPFDLGAAVRGRIGFVFDPDADSPLAIGLGAFATVHWGLKGLGFIAPEIVDNLEVFSELGIAFDVTRHYTTDRRVGFASKSGIAFHLNNVIAIKAGYTNWVSSNGAFIGAHLKFGPGQEVVPKSIKIGGVSTPRLTVPSMPYVQIYLSQFYALYWYVFAAGGYFFDDSTYTEGQGTVWSLTSYDDEDYQMTVHRALLKIMDDGSKWWKIKFSSDDMELLYEVKTDPQYRVVMFRFRDTAEDQSGEYELKPEEVENMNPTDTYVVTEEDYAEWIQGQEKVSTPAGTFNTDYVKTSYSDAEYEWTYNWWVAEDVPGSLVKFKWENSDDEWYQGELVEITTGNAPELGELK